MKTYRATIEYQRKGQGGDASESVIDFLAKGPPYGGARGDALVGLAK